MESLSASAGARGRVALIKVGTENSLEGVGPDVWNSLWKRSGNPSVFARYEWASAWCRAFGADSVIRVYTAWIDSTLVGALPTMWPQHRQAPVVLIGDWHADYAGMLIDRQVPEAFPALLEAVCAEVPASGRFSIAEVRSDSSYREELERRCSAPGSRWLRIEQTNCPRTEITPERVQAIINKDSLKRHARKLRKLGDVVVRHEVDPAPILPRLDDFFAQHVARWAHTASPSLFLDERNRVFYRELVKAFAGTGQLVFTEVTLDDRPVAFHLGFLSEGDFIWYKPSFEPELAKVSPGETLLRELFLWALENGLTGFDFTRGGESFKARFATHQRHTATYVYYGNRVSALSARGWREAKRLARERLPAPVAGMARRWLHRFRG